MAYERRIWHPINRRVIVVHTPRDVKRLVTTWSVWPEDVKWFIAECAFELSCRHLLPEAYRVSPVMREVLEDLLAMEADLAV